MKSMKRILILCVGLAIALLLANAMSIWAAPIPTAPIQKPSPASKPKPRTNSGSSSQGSSSRGNTRVTYTPQHKTYYANGVSFTMVEVRGGTFTMGATSEQGSDAVEYEKPAHKVTLPSYYIGQTEVTQALWQAVMGTNPSHHKGNKLPVESVSWEDVRIFISKLNEITNEYFRLPTEAEWEFAARGGTMAEGFKYSGSNDVDCVAWYRLNSLVETQAVGTKMPNELGIYDMSGNVDEWCQDWYGKYSEKSEYNPIGLGFGSEYPIRRGGNIQSEKNSCRISSRNYNEGTCYTFITGFRLAM